MKAGKYYVGDLCYVLDDRWDELCKITIHGNEVLEGLFMTRDGVAFVMYGTAYGDGVYYDDYGNTYGVDSGTIGCVALEDLNPEELQEAENAMSGKIPLGAIIDFPNEFETRKKGEGLLIFGHIEIDTEGKEEEDNEANDY